MAHLRRASQNEGPGVLAKRSDLIDRLWGGGEGVAMVEITERRRVARLSVPRHLSGPELELRLVRLLDLSGLGARIEHLEPLREGTVCYVDLPPALGRVRLTGRIVWTGVRGGEQTPEGDRLLHYQSGMEFTALTPQQQTALAAVLEKLQVSTTSERRPPS